MRAYQKILCVFLLLMVSSSMGLSGKVFDKNAKRDYYINAGLNFGGPIPIPFPAEIRNIDSWEPGINPSLGINVIQWFDKNWGVSSSLIAEWKGMQTTSQVLYWKTGLEIGEEYEKSYIEGLFSGKNSMKTKHGCFTIPLNITYKTNNEQWIFSFGPYFSRRLNSIFTGNASDGYIRNGGATGEKVLIDSADFDFSKNISKNSYGVNLSVNYFFSSYWGVKINYSQDIKSIFSKNFTTIPQKMYDAYATVGITYRLIKVNTKIINRN